MCNSLPSYTANLTSKYKDLREVMQDKELAALGDAIVNFLYSLALSVKEGRPIGVKVNSRVLSDSLTKAGLRNLLSSRLDRHHKADAAEAVIAYMFLRGKLSIKRAIDTLSVYEDPIEAFTQLLIKIKQEAI